MATPSNDPKKIEYWFRREALKVAEAIHRQSKSGVEVINKLRKHFIGMSQAIAGQIYSLAHKAVNIAFETSGYTGFGTMPTESIPVNPNLFPDGRLGNRFRYRVYTTFTAEKRGDDIPMTIFVRSGSPMSMEQILSRARELAWEQLGKYPSALTGQFDPNTYTPYVTLQSAWRSH
jgi:hypothetical protein